MSSFFKRPSWAVKDPANTSTEFYRRSEQTYSDIVAATREAHQKPKAPKVPEETESTEPKKRPRLSGEKKKKIKEEKECNDDSPVRDTTDEDENEQPPPVEPRNLPSPSQDSSLDTPRKSINKYQNTQRLASESRPSVQSHKTKSPETQSPSLVRSSILQAHTPATRSPLPVQPPPTPADDPVVQIIIESDIPNTKPLLVHRKMSQSLREVRLAWCQRQDFEPDLYSSVHLTWKDRRLFDVTTCRSLGIKAGKESSSILDMDGEFEDQKELRIHMEAVTNSPLLLNRKDAASDIEKPSAASQSPPEDDQGKPMKLVLRSPGLVDFKIKARQETLILRLISAFRNKHNIPVDREVVLEFDGDKLDPDECLGHYDIDDLDLIDAQIK